MDIGLRTPPCDRCLSCLLPPWTIVRPTSSWEAPLVHARTSSTVNSIASPKTSPARVHLLVHHWVIICNSTSTVPGSLPITTHGAYIPMIIVALITRPFPSTPGRRANITIAVVPLLGSEVSGIQHSAIRIAWIKRTTRLVIWGAVTVSPRHWIC
jgi:hypothetical protein